MLISVKIRDTKPGEMVHIMPVYGGGIDELVKNLGQSFVTEVQHLHPDYDVTEVEVEVLVRAGVVVKPTGTT